MSYQPGQYQQPQYQQTPYAQASYPQRRPGTALLAAGVVLVLLGIVIGGAIYVSGKQRYSSKVTSLVEDSGALSGCVTDLAVTKPGTYTLYYVSKGSLRINGANDGCSNNDVVPIAADPNPPEVSIILRNPDGKKLKMSTPTSTAVLKAGGVVAEPYRQVNIGGTGDYSLEIAMPDTGLPFAIGIGPRIEKSSSLLALVVGLFGVVFGVGCGLLGAAQGGSGRRARYAGPYQQYPAGYAQQGGAVVDPYGGAQRPVGAHQQRRPQGPQGPQGARPVQQPPVQQPPVARSAPRPGQPPVARPGQPGQPGPRLAQPGQRPAQPGQQPPVQRPGGARPVEPPPTQAVPPTLVQRQQPPQQPQRPAQPGPNAGLPPIVSSQDESGSLSTAPPTQRMPGAPTDRSGWERETPPPPTRPLSSQRPQTPPEPTEDLDSDD